MSHLSFEETGLVDDGAICLTENFAYAWTKQFCGGSVLMEFKIIKVQ